MKSNFTDICVFDEFPVFNCFEASLYSVVFNMNFNPRYVILNELNKFILNEDKDYSISKSFNLPINNFMNKIGFEYNEIFSKNFNIIEEIMSGIDSGNVYIVQLFGPKSFDAEGTTNHSDNRLHCLVVYGYDMSNKVFFVMDYQKASTYVYNSMNILFNDFQFSYNKNIALNDYACLIKIKRKNEYKNFETYDTVCIRNFLNCFFENIEILQDCLDGFKKILREKNRNMFISYIRNIILFSNYLKKMEYVFDDKIFNRDFYAVVSNLNNNVKTIIDYSIKIFNNEEKYRSDIFKTLNNIETLIIKASKVGVFWGENK